VPPLLYILSRAPVQKARGVFFERKGEYKNRGRVCATVQARTVTARYVLFHDPVTVHNGWVLFIRPVTVLRILCYSDL
jgi:hypothetical protein